VIAVVAFTGGFTVITYFAPVASAAAGIEGAALSAVLLVGGVAAAVGNHLGGIVADRWPHVRSLVLGSAGVAFASLLMAVAAATAHRAVVGAAMMVLGAIVMNLSGWLRFPSIQALLIGHAPDAGTIALSLGSTANFGGIALGGALGGLVLAHANPAAVAFAGTATTVLAMVLAVALRAPISLVHCRVGPGPMSRVHSSE
jgi:predicted MFS family arabinose efflux permease